jgi:glycosyltransferase involved in cell wall biosynthesis
MFARIIGTSSQMSNCEPPIVDLTNSSVQQSSTTTSDQRQKAAPSTYHFDDCIQYKLHGSVDPEFRVAALAAGRKFERMSLRVLHIDMGKAWRGGQRQVLLLARAQRDAGHEPLVVAPPHTPLLSRARAAGLAVSAVGAAGDWDLRAARRVAQRLKTWRPHIVHAHDARAHAIAMAALVGRKRTPLVVTRRVAFVPRGRIKYGPRVARFIAISNAVRDALIEGGVDRDRIDVVYSGVPVPVVDRIRNWRAECNWPEDTVLCGVVGAMTVEKGIGLLDDIASRMPDEDRQRARLVLLGGASVGLTRIGGIEAIRAGFVDEVHRAMAGLDVLWHPASSEGLGTAVIDAMALQVPPIAFRVGGLPELIVDNTCGVLVPAGDVDAFARSAAQLVRDASLRKRLGEAGPSRAEHFSVAKMSEGTSRAYSRVLS